MKNILTILLVFLCATFCSFGQAGSEAPEMADLMRSNGKIYVVVAVVGIIFAGIIVYLVNIDAKLSKIEKILTKNQ